MTYNDAFELYCEMKEALSCLFTIVNLGQLLRIGQMG